MDGRDGPRPLDKVDPCFLRVLQADGRISKLKLAEEVHRSPTALLGRVKRRTREGLILGHEARLNPLKLGAGLLVFVEILLDRTVHGVMAACRAFIGTVVRTLPGVRETRTCAAMEEIRHTTRLKA